MAQSIVQRSFAAGELAPSLAARADLRQYLAGLRTCRNFIVQRQGGVGNRTGTQYVAVAKTTGRTFLRPFIFPALDASFAVEIADGYFRFHRNGQPVTVSGVVAWSAATAYVVGDLVAHGGVNYYAVAASTNQEPPDADYWHPLTGSIYEIPTPYEIGDFLPPAPAGWSQAGTVVTITHLDHPPRELRYESATRWVLSSVVTGPSIAPPVNLNGTPTTVGTRTFRYVVTAVMAETYEESNPSEVLEVTSAELGTPDAPVVLTWDHVDGAVEYRVYGDPYENGTFGYLGTATELLGFYDVGTDPDFGDTPPVPRTLFAAENLYPAVSVVHQQRRIFAGTHTDREDVFASRVGHRSNFGIRSPLQDDDAVSWNLASNLVQPVRHLVGLKQLVVLTDQGEWIVRGGDDGVITPTAINLDQHGYVGASEAAPVIIGNAIVFVQARGTVLRELRFDQQVEGLSGRDLTLWSAHLFKRYGITQIAYAQVPDSIVWCVRSDGSLLGLTYIPDADEWGWHRHDTDGSFEQVVVLPEGQEDAVYVVVRRELGGVERRYIERFATRAYASLADAVFLDVSKTYDGVATTTVSGLTHLAGASVRVLADGVALAGTFRVSNAGVVSLPVSASTIQVGLPITAQIETLDLDVAGSSVRDKRKLVKAIALLLEDSARGFLVGPNLSNLLPHRGESWEATGGLVSGQVEMTLTAGFTNHGRVVIQHTDPTPLTILGLMPLVEVGG